MLKSPAPIPALSARESEVARAYVQGLSYREIAEDLGISPATVRTHLNTIFRKLEVTNKLELLRIVEAVDHQEAAPTAEAATHRGGAPWLVAMVAAGIVAMCVAVAAFWFWPSPTTERAESVFDGPSIAVMPFEINGGDAETRAVFEAINRDIVTDLTHFSDIFVIAASSTFRDTSKAETAQGVGRDLGVRYVLTGVGEWRETGLRATLTVVESDTGRHVWSERFETDRAGLLAFQTDVVTRVVGIIGPIETGAGRLRQAELDRIERRATDSLDAYDLFIQGAAEYERFTAASNAAARDLYLAAIELDPNYGKAYAMAAWTYIVDVWRDRAPDSAATLAKADALLDQGADIDPFEPYLSWSRGGYHLFAGEHDRALEAYRKAIELNPNGADYLMFLGWAMVLAGQASDAYPFMEEAVRRNPYHPGWYLWDIGYAHLFSRKYDQAIAVLESREPKTTGTYELLSVAYARAGNQDAAKAAMQTLLERKPNFSVALIARTEPFARQEDLDWYLDGLRLAGAPETAPETASE